GSEINSDHTGSRGAIRLWDGVAPGHSNGGLGLLPRRRHSERHASGEGGQEAEATKPSFGCKVHALGEAEETEAHPTEFVATYPGPIPRHGSAHQLPHAGTNS